MTLKILQNYNNLEYELNVNLSISKKRDTYAAMITYILPTIRFKEQGWANEWNGLLLDSLESTEEISEWDETIFLILIPFQI